MIDLEEMKHWKDHRVIICTRGIQGLLVEGGTLARCELCGLTISAFRVSVEKVREGSGKWHLICHECGMRAKKSHVRFGGRIRNNKLPEGA